VKGGNDVAGFADSAIVDSSSRAACSASLLLNGSSVLLCGASPELRSPLSPASAQGEGLRRPLRRLGDGASGERLQGGALQSDIRRNRSQPASAIITISIDDFLRTQIEDRQEEKIVRLPLHHCVYKRVFWPCRTSAMHQSPLLILVLIVQPAVRAALQQRREGPAQRRTPHGIERVVLLAPCRLRVLIPIEHAVCVDVPRDVNH